MKSFFKEYLNPNESRINHKLITRELDDDLIQLILDACKSLEVLEYITFLGHTFIEDEKEIDLNEYITTRKKSRKKSDVRYMYQQDSRYVELRLKFKIECKGESDIVNKKLLIPVADENGYYTIKGKKYLLLYQLVDSSTYRSGHNVTLKSFMPAPIKRAKGEFTDTDGTLHTAPTYAAAIFKKEVDILLFYFAKMGVSKTLKYFDVDQIIRFTDIEEDKSTNIYFKMKNKSYLEVNRYFFQKYQYVQSVAFMLLDIGSTKIDNTMLDNKDYWIEWIGSLSASNSYAFYEKGRTTVTFFERLLNITTKKILKVDETNRRSMYSAVRWMIQNYNELRKKDNMDLGNKRLRCNEYIASLLTRAFNERLNRVISAGNWVNLDKVREVFKFSGNLLMEQLHISGLLRYDDRINDMDFYSKLKYTIKGPSSLGQKNKNKISMQYRGIDPSYLGRLDINVCGTSDPGSSGIITPFCKTDGLFFDGSGEPESGIFDYSKEIRDTTAERNPGQLVVDPYENCETIYDVFNQQKHLKNIRNLSSYAFDDSKSEFFNVIINTEEVEEEL